MTSITTLTGSRVRFAPISTQQTWCFVRENGNNTNGYVNIGPGGSITIGKAPNESFIGGVSGNTGLENGVAITYTTA